MTPLLRHCLTIFALILNVALVVPLRYACKSNWAWFGCAGEGVKNRAWGGGGLRHGIAVALSVAETIGLCMLLMMLLANSFTVDKNH